MVKDHFLRALEASRVDISTTKGFSVLKTPFASRVRIFSVDASLLRVVV